MPGHSAWTSLLSLVERCCIKEVSKKRGFTCNGHQFDYSHYLSSSSFFSLFPVFLSGRGRGFYLSNTGVLNFVTICQLFMQHQDVSIQNTVKWLCPAL